MAQPVISLPQPYSWMIMAAVISSAAPRLTIPIGTIFNSKSQDLNEAISAMSFAMQEHESSNRSQEHVLKFYVDNIDTVDAYKLTKIICKQVEALVFPNVWRNIENVY